METLPNQSQMLLMLEAEVFTDILYNIGETIPAEEFKEILDCLLTQDFHDKFEYDLMEDSEDVLDKFIKFSVSTDQEGFTYSLNTYLVELIIKVDYEVKRSELVNDVSFSIDEITVYDNEGDEMVLDYMQADQIKKAVESQNYKA